MVRRAASLFALVGFLATGPGLAGVELGAHLSGLVDPAHARQIHVEAAGSLAHADHCQLGLGCGDGRPPTPVPAGPRHRVTAPPTPDHPPEVVAAATEAAPSLPRAPPRLLSC